jgi:hypothetical protein
MSAHFSASSQQSRVAHEMFSMEMAIQRSILASLQLRVFFVGARPASASFFWSPIDDTPKWLVMDDCRLSVH